MAVALLGIKETAPGERRVALTPETARKLGALGITVWYQPGAGQAAGFTDAAYDDAGARAPRACQHRTLPVASAPSNGEDAACR